MTPPSSSSAERREPLNRQRVLLAALKMADEEGLEVLSMRRLGQALGVEAMSLYKHVSNKDDLLDGITDLVVGEIEIPAKAATWKEAMRARAISAHQVLLRHRWATVMMGSRLRLGPSMLRYVDLTLGWLLEAGFSEDLAVDAWHTMDSFIYGYTLQELNLPFDQAQSDEVATGFLQNLPAEQFPHFHRVVRNIIGQGYRDNFDFGLELLLEGLEARRKNHPLSPY
ncbi:TetR/AcrR family transcriptional regulator C-terminal domain-containing protein [Deinococcus cellulosilyticus]|uniref:TetR family transcriptional regulator n=1 Tax=Deinococcus cellulosilyticus (strain DSM 18568 / NBRC 106333 / KACC 11606 / 5516J-15) TaxID=1223518 RepID=A0A511N9D9_DEIC1|nr:TetR/AcrR family transcriptional regulator C-terminal domain-containing protein [Deinococcus cellulosilyticus]GEM49136.1 TetR family transcriptional regulator [Deinococcus cellulosilyticus NBRC 106333 = KACC 11606]